MGEARIERRLAAILAADVAGYSRLMGVDEEGTLSVLKTYRRELIEPKIAEHGGRIVKTTGDGALIEFASAVNALRCALEIQHAVAERNAELPRDRRIEFRIGINVGDIIVDTGDIYGDGVNVAARLEGIAEPGGICVSARVQEDTQGKLDVTFEDQGEQQFKNIARPVRVYRVRLDGCAVYPASVLPDKPSIAVLPFDNMSPGVPLAELCLGLPEGVITGLSRLRWLNVASRNLSFGSGDIGRDVVKLAGRLGVQYFLEGSVQKSGSRLRVIAQLIDARGGRHLWAERYDSNTDDLFTLQDELIQKIVAAIEQTLVSALIRSSGNEVPLRRANRLHRSLRREDSADAQRLLRELVTSSNPSVAMFQLLANTLEVTVDCFWAEDPAAAIAEALEASQKAIQIAPLDYLSNYVLGRALLHSHRYDLAIAAARRSVELNPNSGTSLGGLGNVLAFAGDAKEAAEIGERAFRVSPPEPYTALWIWYAAIAAMRLQQFETALKHAEAGILIKPDVATGHLLRAIACSRLSRFADGEASIQDAIKSSQSLSLARMPKFLPYRDGADLEQALEALRKVRMPS
jgi:class 3 adenylate cyclase/TolB-like protein/Flp pilus assembly protein TadD